MAVGREKKLGSWTFSTLSLMNKIFWEMTIFVTGPKGGFLVYPFASRREMEISYPPMNLLVLPVILIWKWWCLSHRMSQCVGTPAGVCENTKPMRRPQLAYVVFSDLLHPSCPDSPLMYLSPFPFLQTTTPRRKKRFRVCFGVLKLRRGRFVLRREVRLLYVLLGLRSAELEVGRLESDVGERLLHFTVGWRRSESYS